MLGPQSDDHAFDLMILDVQMPDMDGFEVERKVRGSEFRSPRGIIFLSSLGTRQAVTERGESPGNAYLTKPIKRSALMGALVTVLGDGGSPPSKTSRPKNHHSRTGERHRGIRARVLLVDDNAVNRRVARGILQKLGHEVQEAENGRVALEILQRMSFDLVFMDAQMPEMDGFEATRRIRAKDPRRNNLTVFLVVILSAAKDLPCNYREILRCAQNDSRAK